VVGTGLFSHRTFVLCTNSVEELKKYQSPRVREDTTIKGDANMFQSPRACETTQEMTENDEGDVNMFQSPRACEKALQKRTNKR